MRYWPRLRVEDYDRTTKKITAQIVGYPKATINVFKGRVTSVEPAAFKWMLFRVFVNDVEPWLQKKNAKISEIETEL